MAQSIKLTSVQSTSAAKLCLALLLGVVLLAACGNASHDNQGAPFITEPLDGQQGRIAFTSKGSIWIIQADGTGLTELAQGGRPIWSPDGTQILFTPRDITHATMDVIRADAPDVRSVISTKGVAIAWSPDSQFISYTSGAKGQDDVHIIDANGVHQRQLTDEGSYQHAWSFDSSTIAFRCKSAEICVVDANGTREQQITNNHAGNFAWSPTA